MPDSTPAETWFAEWWDGTGAIMPSKTLLARIELIHQAGIAAYGAGRDAERERIMEIIAAEGNRLVAAAIARMPPGALDEELTGLDILGQVVRGSAIASLARRLPDLLKAADLSARPGRRH